ncbi:MAG: hypothetical protein LBI77_04050 [Puniceicoccales bacterium]|jgi:peptidyl-prolyl cis-trans isomerase D|nr:hypothetical protein [Puniceicoccales bacterium]
MISLLQKILQKHHRWLFSILLLIVIFSFVFTVGSSPGIGRSRGGKEKKIFGYDFSSQKDILPLIQELELSIQLQRLFVAIPGLKDYALLSRLATLKLASDLNIPKPNKDLLRRFIEDYPFFMNEKQQFDSNKYNDFLAQMQKDPEQLALSERTIANDFKIASVEKLLSGWGYCLDIQAKSALLGEQRKYSFLSAKFDASMVSNEIKYGEDEIKEYFEAHGDSYKIGEQIVLDYIEFPKELFMEKVEKASPSELQHFYEMHGDRFEHLREGSDELEKELTEAYEDEQISQLAAKTADQLTYSLYEKNIARDSKDFQGLIEAMKLKISHLEPIPLGQFSGNKYFSSEPLLQGSKLNNERYYSDPVYAKNGNIAILLYGDIIPSLYPPLDSVKDQVRQDFLAWRKEEIFLDQVKEIQKTLGDIQDITDKDFTKIVTDRNGIVTTFTAETLNNQKISPQQKEILLSLKSKNVSSVIFTGKMEAEIIFLESRDEPSEIDPDLLEKKTMALEREYKKSFNGYVTEIILDELGIKENRAEAMQHYQMMSSFISMQQNRKEFSF